MTSDLNNIIATFDRMQEDGWQIDKDLKWGFYFLDSEKDTLLKIFEELKDSGYKIETIEKVDDAEEYTLHVSKVDTLTPEKLHRRNLAFNELAEYFSALGYDGWDVEKIR